MWLKAIIAVLVLAMVISVFTGFHFLGQDLGGGRRTFRALAVRITIAVLLAAALIYGFASGILTMQAPWHGRY